MEKHYTDNGPMLNAYPDSLGGTLTDIASLLETKEMQGAFCSFYILPSVFTTDLDRGFSVISYDLDPDLTAPGDMDRLRAHCAALEQAAGAIGCDHIAVDRDVAKVSVVGAGLMHAPGMAVRM